MNRKHLLSALAFAVIGTSAFAQEATSDSWMQALARASRSMARSPCRQPMCRPIWSDRSAARAAVSRSPRRPEA